MDRALASRSKDHEFESRSGCYILVDPGSNPAQVSKIAFFHLNLLFADLQIRLEKIDRDLIQKWIDINVNVLTTAK